MALSPTIRRAAESQVRDFCDRRVPSHLRDRIRLEVVIRGNAIAIVERRPLFFDLDAGTENWTSMRIAQLRFDAAPGAWTLHWADRNGRWHLYDDVDPSPDVGPILREIEDDPTGIFWG